MRVLPAILLSGLLSFNPAAAQNVTVDLQLAMGSDVSRSVDEEEASLQRDGYIRAFSHPSILEAIQRGPLGRIAVMYFEWGGAGVIRTVVDWMVIRDRETIALFAAKLATGVPMSARRTGISGAISFAAEATDNNGYSSRRKVIDLSGDGANNSGMLVNLARDAAVARGFTINGLPIVNRRPTGSGWRQIENLDLYYRDCVIGGPGAFHIVANDFKDFGRAVMRKLILEIANAQPPRSLFRLARFKARPSPPCDIGEIRRRQRWGSQDDDDWLPLAPPPQPGRPAR